ncbi:aldo/keto reductase [Kaistia adipata]|uniref:aldo/keto reductase n=1 Tax=Kaistia adipata TaxID=166954 RepID=UPI000422F9F1|nr:aldo/keto reductase [Kaistia adipata]
MFEKRPVGHTSLAVGSLSFGCASIGNLGSAISDAQATEVLNRAWDTGIRYFDTAPHYGRGRSEQRLGRFLAGKPRGEHAISTKVGRVLRPGEQLTEADGFADPLPNAVHYDYTEAGFAESLESSRARLGVDYIDIVFVHDIGPYTHGPAGEHHVEDLLSSGLPYLARLKAEGKIGAYGLGVNETEICLRVLRQHPLDVILMAGRWTLLDRDAEAELAPLCRERGTSFVLGGIFNSGILATGAKPGAWFNYEPASEEILGKVRDLETRCAAHGVTLPHAALQFALTRPGVASVLLGTSKTSSLDRNLAMAAEPLSPEAAAALFD